MNASVQRMTQIKQGIFYAHEMATAYSPEYPTPVDIASKYGLKGQQAYNHGTVQ